MAAALIEDQNWKRAADTAEEAVSLARKGAYVSGLARALRHLSFSRYITGENMEALREASESLRLFQGIADRKGEADALGVMALVRWTLGAYDQALKEGMKAMRIYQDLRDDQGLAWCHYVAGGLSQSLGDHQQALEYQRKALYLFEAIGDNAGLARSLTGLGSVFRVLGDPVQALDHHKRALDLFRVKPNSLGEARSLTEIAIILQERGEMEEALSHHMQALSLRRSAGAKLAEVTNLLQIARIHLERGEIGRALQVAQEALNTAESGGGMPKVFDAHQILAEAYEKLGEPVLALHHYKQFHTIRDEVFSEERAIQLKNLQISFETEKSQKEAEMFRMINEGLRAKNDQLARLIEDLQAAQAQLVHVEKMAGLGDLVAGVAHELNSPAGALLSAGDVTTIAAERIVQAVETAQSLETLRSDKSFTRTVDMLRENNHSLKTAAQRISQIVKTLRSFAHLDEAAYQRTDLEKGIENTLTLLEPRLEERIDVIREFSGIPPVYCFAADLNQVFLNILTNAIQSIEGKGQIIVSTGTANRHLVVSCTDSGKGIPPEAIQHLFTPRFQRKGSSIRASMSLFTCYQIVRRHKGDLLVESEVGKGSKFTIALPRTIESHWLDA